MMLRKLYESLQSNQISFFGLNSISELEKIDLDFKEGRFLFILEVLKMGKALGFKIFNESSKEISIQEIKKLLAGAKSYNANKPIVAGKLRLIIEGLVYEFKDLDLQFNLIPELLIKKISIFDFLKCDEIKKQIEYKEQFKKSNGYIFVGKSGKIYEGDGMNELRKYTEVDVLDIIEGYNGENETLKKVIPYILNNKDELKKEFNQYRLSIISALSILLGLESKAVNYILAKLENNETNETQTVSSIAPF